MRKENRKDLKLKMQNLISETGTAMNRRQSVGGWLWLAGSQSRSRSVKSVIESQSTIDSNKIA